MSALSEKQKLLPGSAPFIFVGGYFGLSYARSAGWIPDSWSLIPIVETAWLNFLVVLAAIIWMRVQKIPLAHVGLVAFQPSRLLLLWVIGTMAIDTLAIGIATPAVTSVFGEAQHVARFEDLPGNFRLLIVLMPFIWLIAAFGEEFFYRGFLLTVIAELLGASRAAWITAVVFQAIAFGLVHSCQGPAQAIFIGIGGGVYGAAFLLAKRNLWPLIIAHGLNDTLGFILLYSGVIQR